MGCPFLRMDTNERNTRARAMYAKLSYKEIGIVPCVFNGIEGVGLVLLEKPCNAWQQIWSCVKKQPQLLISALSESLPGGIVPPGNKKIPLPKWQWD